MPASTRNREFCPGLPIQQNIAPDKLARVYSFDLMGSFLARPVGLAFVGPISAVIGVTEWLWVCVLVMAGGSLAAAALPSARRLERLTMEGNEVKAAPVSS